MKKNTMPDDRDEKTGEVTGGLTVHLYDAWADIAQAAAAFLATPPADPFSFDGIVVPGHAHRRQLSQTIAVANGAADGVCAGVDFIDLRELRRRLGAALLGIDPATDPWGERGLTLAVNDLMAVHADATWFAPVAHHLGAHGSRPGRRLATASRIARNFLGYTRHRPQMLAAWERSEDISPAGQPLQSRHRWQPPLWRATIGLLAQVPPPPVRHQQLLTAIVKAPEFPFSPRLGAALLLPPDEQDRELLTALAERCEVEVWQLAHCGSSREGLANRYARPRLQAADRWPSTQPPVAPTDPGVQASLLQRVQYEIRAGQTPDRSVPRLMDGSVQIHAAHEADRQVAVLRDLLCGVLEDSPDLEPRDIVVLCPALADYAPHIAAAFTLDDGTDAFLHPGHGIRVQLAGGALPAPNPVLVGLQRVLSLEDSRATVQDLLDLCALPPIAHRFGFSRDDLGTLAELMAKAGIHWGIDREHRKSYGLGEVPQGTWLAGVNRMLVGVATADKPPTSLDVVLPLAMRESSSIGLVANLAELVSRLRYCRMKAQQTASISEWLERLRHFVDLLFDTDFDHAWQLNHAHGELAALADRAADREAELGVGDILVLLDQLVRPQYGRANYGNGSLLITSLGDASGIESEVVCVLGLDDQHFPPPAQVDGDDLLADDPDVLAEDERTQARHQLSEALLAARRAFLVVTKGASGLTNERLNPPLPILDLLGACAIPGSAGAWRPDAESGTGPSLVTHHPLQAHSIHNFRTDQGLPFSFDRAAMQGAWALAQRRDERDETQPAWARTFTPASGIRNEVSLKSLCAFYRNPARQLLQETMGLATEWSIGLSAELPLEMDGLSHWKVGDEWSQALLAGATPEAAQYQAQLSGRLPPGALASRTLHSSRINSQELVSRLERFSDLRTAFVDIDLVLNDDRLSGSEVLRGEGLVAFRSGKVRGQDLLDIWLRLLAVGAVMTEFRPVGVFVTAKSCTQLACPPANTCRELLRALLALRAAGLQQVVPLPIKTSTRFTRLDPSYGDPVANAQQAWQGGKGKDDAEARKEEWRLFFGDRFEDLQRPRSLPTDPAGNPATSRFEALAHWLHEPVQTAIALGRDWPEVGR